MTRILSALVLIAIVVGAIWLLPPWGTVAFALVALVAAVREWTVLAARQGDGPSAWLVLAGTSAVLLGLAEGWYAPWWAMAAAAILAGAQLVFEGRADRDAIRRAATTLFPLVYLGVPLGAMAAVRREHGPLALLVLLAITAVSDSAQYYGGRLTGRRPLAPRVSPKKTVEGALWGVSIGGLVLPAIGSRLLPATSPWVLWMAGVLLVVLGILGDLFESLLKRSAGVKDASALIPGHGGVLDRIDSLLFAAPFYYAFLLWTMQAR